MPLAINATKADESRRIRILSEVYTRDDSCGQPSACFCVHLWFHGFMRIVPVATPEDLAIVRQLFEEYWQSFGFTPCFQNFAAEVAGLPGYYAPPAGRLALAFDDGGEPAGCIALRPVDPSRAEAKRLYVRPAYRGQGTGLALLEWVIGEARAAGYREMLGDTMPAMQRALAMYARLGFEQTGPYAPNPTPGAIYLRLAL
jgi:GNAT superfamily N-acetyltransferase